MDIWSDKRIEESLKMAWFVWPYIWDEEAAKLGGFTYSHDMQGGFKVTENFIQIYIFSHCTTK